jgi:serine protease inhibitor ecotin
MFRVMFLALTAFATSAKAETIMETQILKIYAQSHEGSGANAIQLAATLPTQCSMNRVYVAFEDRELLASALAYMLSGKPAGVIYTTSAAPKDISGHMGGLSCKLISIF